MATKIDIGGELNPRTVEGIVADASTIIDRTVEKRQDEINSEVSESLEEKQDVIADLETIRSGAASGSTAIQPTQIEDVVRHVDTGALEPLLDPSDYATTNQLNQLGKIIGTELFNYDFGETGTYQCWVEKLYSLLSRAGVDSDNNEYGYTFQIPASGTITITRPTVGRWRVYFYTKLGDTAGTSESAWITTDSSQFTMPTGTSAIRIIFQSASGYLNADYLDYAFTISGAVPYGGAYRKIVEVHADRVAGAKAEIVNDVLFAEKSEQIITTMDVGYYTTNGYNKVASASRLLAYRIPVRTPFLISCDSNYLMNFYYGKTQDRASRQNDSTWVSYFYVQIDEPGWVSIIVRRSDNASVTSQDILDCKLTITQQPGYITNQETFGDAGLISYGGSRPALSNQAKVWRGYNPGNIPLNQDGSAYGDYLFSINNGVFYSYKISTRTRINNGTSLGRTFHANTVMFGSEVASGSNFPLLYVSDTKNHKLAVYKVTGDETAFALEYQYDIDCTTIDTSLIGKGDSSFFVDAENGFLYLFRYKETGYPTTPVMTNGVYITRFNLPQSGTVLTSSDILDTVYLNNFDYAAIQGGFVSHGQIYFAVGTGPYTTTAYLDVYEPLQQKVITCLNLTKMFPGEPEAVTYIEEEKAILFANSGVWMRVRF